MTEDTKRTSGEDEKPRGAEDAPDKGVSTDQPAEGADDTPGPGRGSPRG